jgi:hypothetical protein
MSAGRSLAIASHLDAALALIEAERRRVRRIDFQVQRRALVLVAKPACDFG